MPPPTDAELDKMFEDSKNDRHNWVGSDIRMLVAEIRRLRHRDTKLTESVSAVHDTLRDAVGSENARLIGLAADDAVERINDLLHSINMLG